MVDIVTRASWGARAPKAVHRIALPTPRLWVHHTATEQHGAAGVRAIQAYHMDTKRWNDIAYSFLVDDDGTIYEGRGVGIAGGHTEGDNTRSHAVCLMGNFENRPPTARAIASEVVLARHGRDAGWWVPTLGGHRDAPDASTACPGRFAYALLPEIRTRVALNPLEDDLPYTPEQIRDLAAEGARIALGEGTALGYLGWPKTNQGQTDLLRAIYTRVSGEDPDDIDEAEIARLLLAGLTAPLVQALKDELPEIEDARIEAAAERGVRRVFADAATPDSVT